MASIYLKNTQSLRNTDANLQLAILRAERPHSKQSNLENIYSKGCPEDGSPGRTQHVGTEASSGVIFGMERMVGQSPISEEDHHISKGALYHRFYFIWLLEGTQVGEGVWCHAQPQRPSSTETSPPPGDGDGDRKH